MSNSFKNTPCNKAKYKCGETFPTSCSPYTGVDLTFLPAGQELNCDANVDEVIFYINQALTSLVSGNDLTGLNPQGLPFTPATVKINQLHQIEINAIQANTASIAAIEEQLNTLDVGTLPIAINMQCLTADTEPCATAPGVYQLISVLNSMLNEICLLKANAGI